MSIKVYKIQKEVLEEVKSIAENNQALLNEMGRRSGAIIDVWRRVTDYQPKYCKPEVQLSDSDRAYFSSEGVDPSLVEDALNSDLPGLGRGRNPPMEVMQSLAAYSGYGLELKCTTGLYVLDDGQDDDQYGFCHNVYDRLPMVVDTCENLEEMASAIKQTL